MQSYAAVSEGRLALRPSAIREMTITSRKLGAVNLSQRFPDHDPPIELQRMLSTVLSKNGTHQYSEPRGVRELRCAIVRSVGERYGLDIDPDHNVVITCGATEGMMVALQASFETGDKV